MFTCFCLVFLTHTCTHKHTTPMYVHTHAHSIMHKPPHTYTHTCVHIWAYWMDCNPWFMTSWLLIHVRPSFIYTYLSVLDFIDFSHCQSAWESTKYKYFKFVSFVPSTSSLHIHWYPFLYPLHQDQVQYTEEPGMSHDFLNSILFNKILIWKETTFGKISSVWKHGK